MDDATKTITLQGLLALCPSCHSVKHSDATTSADSHAVAMKHLERINEWSPEEVQAYVAYVKRYVCVRPLALRCAWLLSLTRRTVSLAYRARGVGLTEAAREDAGR